MKDNSKEKRNVTVTLRLDNNIYNEIKKYAENYGISFNAMLKVLLKDIIDEKEN